MLPLPGFIVVPLQEMPFPLSSAGVEVGIGNTQDKIPTNNNDITGDTDEPVITKMESKRLI
jgi:hypothetical protein